MDIIALRISSSGVLIFTINLWLLLAVAVVSVVAIVWFRSRKDSLSKSFEIDEAEIGIGSHKIKLKPNDADVQIAYQLWVELSTRKIGLPIDFEHDVIQQIYDSWYDFFKVTRGLLKGIPASKLRVTASTQKLIQIAIDILNEGLRPHLTLYQARFGRWMTHQLAHEGTVGKSPQEIQVTYPDYAKLKTDMEQVNRKLIRYRATLKTLVFSDAPQPPTERSAAIGEIPDLPLVD
jgi:hypothetical protein